MKPVVSLVRYEDISTVAKAIELCDGFKNLKAGSDLLASGHTGIEIRVNTSTMCSGCDANLKGPTMLLAALCRNKDFHGLQIVAGKNLRDEQNSPRTILFGNCPIKENKHLEKAKRLEGCPPKFWDSLFFIVNQMPGLGARMTFYSRLAAKEVKEQDGIYVETGRPAFTVMFTSSQIRVIATAIRALDKTRPKNTAAIPADFFGPAPASDAEGYVIEASVPVISWIGCPYYLLDSHDTLDKLDRSELRPIAETVTALVETFMSAE